MVKLSLSRYLDLSVSRSACFCWMCLSNVSLEAHTPSLFSTLMSEAEPPWPSIMLVRRVCIGIVKLSLIQNIIAQKTKNLLITLVCLYLSVRAILAFSPGVFVKRPTDSHSMGSMPPISSLIDVSDNSNECFVLCDRKDWIYLQALRFSSAKNLYSALSSFKVLVELTCGEACLACRTFHSACVRGLVRSLPGLYSSVPNFLTLHSYTMWCRKTHVR